MTYKATEIFLLQMLMEESDADHILPIRALRDMLTARGLTRRDGSHIDDRTIRTSIEVLIDAGYDISTYQENGVGYYLRERDFLPSEVHLLMDAVYSSQAIPPRHTEDLIAKLQTLLSSHQRKAFRNLMVVRAETKTNNPDVFLNIELLDEAIQEGVQVRFKYMAYDPEENRLHPRRGGAPYKVSPFRLLSTNGHYYLFCRKEGKEAPALYRIDLIRNLELTADPVGSPPTREEMSTLETRTVYAWYGVPETVELRCSVGLCGNVVDTFGSSARFQREAGRETYRVTVKAVPGGVRLWALQHLPDVEVLSPRSLRAEIIEAIHNNPYDEDAE